MSKLKHIFRPLYVPVMNLYHKHFVAAKRYRYLFDAIKETHPKVLLEVGTWNGNRAAQMIAVAQEVSGKDVRYIGFDLFEDLSDEMYHYELSKRPPSRADVEKKLKETGAEITLIQGNTLKTLPEFASKSEKVDFIFIDGGHHPDTIRNDWEAVRTLMNEKTIVIFDDYWRNNTNLGAKPVVDAIDTSLYNVSILPIVDIFDNPDFGRLEISFAKVTLAQ